MLKADIEKSMENSKKKKIVTIVTTSILALILFTVVAIVIYCFTDKDYGLDTLLSCDAFYSSWQDSIADSAKLNEIVTVGSHDAGSDGMMPLARTQAHSIFDQLSGGSRYFDLRITGKGDDLVIFHGPIKGQKFSKILKDLNAFITAHPTQFIILDFQHLGKNVNYNVMTMIENMLDMTKVMKKSVCQTIEGTSMGEIRANQYNYIIIWPNSQEANQKDYLYAREDNLYSPYDADFHKSKDLNTLINHYQDYYDSYYNTGFFVLQAQRTATHLLGKPSKHEVKFRSTINKYIASLTNSPNLKKTNIVMRDFVVSDMSNVKTILALNLAKKLIKEDCIATFTQMTAV